MRLRRYRTEIWRRFQSEDVEVLGRSLDVLMRFPKEKLKQCLGRWKVYLHLLELDRKRRIDESRAREIVSLITKSKRLERTFFEKESIRFCDHDHILFELIPFLLLSFYNCLIDYKIFFLLLFLYD